MKKNIKYNRRSKPTLFLVYIIIGTVFAASLLITASQPTVTVFAAESTTNNAAQLHTDGRWIKNSGNQIVFLRGVNRPSLEWRTDGAKWVESTWDTMASWGCNAVRVSFTKSWWDNNEPTIDGMLYRQKIDQAITWGQKRGIYTIVDMHWWTRTQKMTPMPPNVPDWINTWKEIANIYKNNPYVLFDLWNEPYNVPESRWWNAAQQCVNAIRSTGAQNLILVSVLNWSHDANVVQKLGPIIGENIVYSVHLYPHEFDGSNTVAGIKREITRIGWKYILDNNIAPVIIGEFGAYPDDLNEVAFIEAICRIANGQENSDGTDWRMGYLAWWFIPYPEEHALVYQNWVTPTASGKALIKYLENSLPNVPSVSTSVGESNVLVNNTPQPDLVSNNEVVENQDWTVGLPNAWSHVLPNEGDQLFFDSIENQLIFDSNQISEYSLVNMYYQYWFYTHY